MSGVLDRMAKRALGALPTVEPRSTPLFAPSAIGFTGAEIAAVGSEEVFAEAENSRSNVDNSQRKNRVSHWKRVNGRAQAARNPSCSQCVNLLRGH